MPMTFESLTQGCTNDEKEKLAWHLSQMRAKKTYEALRPEKYCFTYCGDERCNCGASPALAWGGF